jgi:hypothetical protein
LTTTLREAVAKFRNSVGAVMRIHSRPPDQVDLAITGSAWCIAADRYFVTAHHVMNAGAVRDPSDRFVVFVSPDNGLRAYHFPVVRVPFEDPALDLAILEIAPSSEVSVDAVPITTARVPDGTRVLTLGFPAPAVVAANLDPEQNWIGGNVFLKSHANEGIVAAAYDVDGVLQYELNVGWHHGESGGPVIAVEDEPAAFCVMQHYRNIQTPLGTVAGPHMGRALSCIEPALRAHGAQFV